MNREGRSLAYIKILSSRVGRLSICSHYSKDKTGQET